MYNVNNYKLNIFTNKRSKSTICRHIINSLDVFCKLLRYFVGFVVLYYVYNNHLFSDNYLVFDKKDQTTSL